MKLAAIYNIMIYSNTANSRTILIPNVQISMEDQVTQGQPETDLGHYRVLLFSQLPLVGAAIRLRMKLAIYFITISSSDHKLTDNLILNVQITIEDQFTQDQPETDWNHPTKIVFSCSVCFL